MKLSFRKQEVRRAVHCVSFTLLIAGRGLLPNVLLAEGGLKRYPVTAEMVVTAMRHRQLPTEGVEVRLAAPITAATDNPMLEIQTVTQINPRSAQLKIACRNRTHCLPFYVSATWPEATSGGPTSPSAEQANQPRDTPQQLQPRSDVTVKPGSHATLLLEEGKVHIRLQVVCLQGGSTGDKVRVSTPDHKVSYKAEIVAPNLLKGSF